VSGGWLRPTVFGAVDGLVTNASLIAGLGGGQASAHTIVLTGVAALVAGAFSMGTGEYISVTNQNELVHAEVALEKKMHALFPVAEQEELAGYFREYGADPETADRMAAAVSKDPGTALRVHTREELGVDPAELPSPLLAGRHPDHHGRGAGHRRDGGRPAHRAAGAALGRPPVSAGRAGHRGDVRDWQPHRWRARLIPRSGHA
jgi:hypothetical protein